MNSPTSVADIYCRTTGTLIGDCDCETCFTDYIGEIVTPPRIPRMLLADFNATITPVNTPDMLERTPQYRRHCLKLAQHFLRTSVPPFAYRCSMCNGLRHFGRYVKICGHSVCASCAMDFPPHDCCGVGDVLSSYIKAMVCLRCEELAVDPMVMSCGAVYCNECLQRECATKPNQKALWICPMCHSDAEFAVKLID